MGVTKILSLFSNLKIKYKIFFLIAVLMATIITITNIVHRVAFYAYDELVYEQSAQALSISTLGIESELKKIASLSYTVVSDPSIQDYLWNIRNGETEYDHFVMYTKIRQRLVDLGALYKYVHSFQLYDIHGKEYTVGSRPLTLMNERIDRLREEAEGKKGGIAWTPPDENDQMLTAVRDIRKFQELSLESLGILAVRIDVNRLVSDFGKGYVSEDVQFSIMKNDRQFIYPEVGHENLKAVADINAGDHGYKIVQDNNKSYFISFQPSTYTDWTYITVMPYDQVFYTTENAKRIVLIAFIILFIIAVFISYHLSKRITDPLEKLTLKMRKVQLGNFEIVDEPAAVLAMDEAGQLQRHFRIMLERINELIQENYVKQLVIRDTEFKALQAQINPHFLYNTLESINWMAKMSKQTQISQMVESLGFLLRLSISDKESTITLQRELEIVSHYLIIQKYRFEERLNYSFSIGDNIKQCIVPKLAIQPIVENAVNYALEPMIEPCTIKISAEATDNKLLISIIDNGPGMSEAFLDQLRAGDYKPKGTGVGLTNIRHRIKMLYGDCYDLKIESIAQQGTTVTLILPYIIVGDEHG